MIGQAFNKIWWNDDKYLAQRNMHEDEVREPGASLKVAAAEWIRDRMHLQAGVPGVDVPGLAAEVELLRAAVIDGVITTNYDDLVRTLFPHFPPYIGQEDLLFSDAQFIAESYFIHGSVDRPQTLVLTQQDYERVESTSKYLVAKLLTIFAEHPVIFLGYSIGDPYIKQILADIALAVGQDHLRELGERLYFVEWDTNPLGEPSIGPGDQATEWGVVPMTRITTHDFAPIFAALTRLERPFPASILRELRKHVYNLVQDPSAERVSVVAVPLESNEAEGLRVVFGVGNYDDRSVSDFQLAGMRRLAREDLLPDLLEGHPSPHPAESWVEHGLPLIAQAGSAGYMPVFKHLSAAGRLNDVEAGSAGSLDPGVQRVADRVRAMKVSKQNSTRFHRTVSGVLTTPQAIIESAYPDYFKFDCLILTPRESYEIDDLRDVLCGYWRRGSELGSSFWRAVCYYDILLYAPHLAPTPTDIDS